MYILMQENHKFHNHPLRIRKSSKGKKLATLYLVRQKAKAVYAKSDVRATSRRV